jgi:hypothetical protein
MRISPILTCLPVAIFAALLSACDTNGSYDTYGTYTPPATATTQVQHIQPPASTIIDKEYREPEDYTDRRTDYAPRPLGPDANYGYDRLGYYDDKGYYAAEDSSLHVPPSMFPPPGTCRVWFPERSPAKQPRLESCEGIRHRLPAGAYVIFGG